MGGAGVSLFDDESNESMKKIIYKCLSTAAIKWSCLFFCPLNHSTVLFKGATFYSTNCKYAFCEDYALWIDLLFEKNFNFANMDKTLVKMRKNQKISKSVNVSKKYQNEQCKAAKQ